MIKLNLIQTLDAEFTKKIAGNENKVAVFLKNIMFRRSYYMRMKRILKKLNPIL